MATARMHGKLVDSPKHRERHRYRRQEILVARREAGLPESARKVRSEVSCFARCADLGDAAWCAVLLVGSKVLIFPSSRVSSELLHHSRVVLTARKRRYQRRERMTAMRSAQHQYRSLFGTGICQRLQRSLHEERARQRPGESVFCLREGATSPASYGAGSWRSFLTP